MTIPYFHGKTSSRLGQISLPSSPKQTKQVSRPPNQVPPRTPPDVTRGSATPKIVPSLSSRPVVRVTCGAQHSLARTATGLLWAWGCNEHGQLGLGDLKPRFRPEQVEGSGEVAMRSKKPQVIKGRNIREKEACRVVELHLYKLGLKPSQKTQTYSPQKQKTNSRTSKANTATTRPAKIIRLLQHLSPYTLLLSTVF